MWSLKSLFWLGRIVAVKTVVLPKLAYCFCELSVQIPIVELKIFQPWVLKFDWGPKGYRFACCMLYTPKGFRSPRFCKYYRAAQLIQLYLLQSSSYKPDWIRLEAQVFGALSTDLLIWIPSKSHRTILCPFLLHALRLWSFALNPLCSLHMPVTLLYNNFELPLDHNLFNFSGGYICGHFLD